MSTQRNREIGDLSTLRNCCGREATAFIEKFAEIQRTVEQLLTQLQSSEHDAFAAHLYQSRREYLVSLR